ncbi:MAG: U32 family peptidase [Planctomycetes bacterium]|nr:U32 family peptidase [Planctomycetota bacterium]
MPVSAPPSSTRARRRRPEVLAPAGDSDCIRAAIENGADAVYFGLDRHNARIRAANFTLEGLPDLLSYLHLRGVKAYVAFNTLIFSDELDEVERTLEQIVAAGPDALILQDLGVARLVRAISPDIPLHASTQTTTTSAEAMVALRELGFSRVILARELSVKEIRRIAAATSMALEVFVHGALCVAYSGQCLTSEALGGRSANRGACAQACRLPYDLVVDGAPRDLGDRQYLLSPLDLAAYDLIPELVDAGVSCFKIEGRLKTPEYVAATSRAYRKAVDEAWAGRAARWAPDEVLELQQVFTRGFSHGFLDGADHQSLIPALSPKKRGPFLGRVSAIADGRVRLRIESPVKPGDGVSFDYGSPDDEAGGRVYGVRQAGRRSEAAEAGGEVELTFGEMDWSRVHVGDRVWKTSDPAMEKRLRASFGKTVRRVPVDAIASGRSGAPLLLEFTDGEHRIECPSETPLAEARNRPLTPEFLREHLGRLGATPFELRDLEVRLEGAVMLPVSALNEVRRRAAEELERVRKASVRYAVSRGALGRLRDAVEGSWGGLQSARRTPARTEVCATKTPAQLVVLCRSLDQLRAVLGDGFREIELDFEDMKRYREAVPMAHDAGARVALAPPRIHKPGEDGLLKLVESCAPDAVLVRNLAHLACFAGRLETIGDFSLNAANDLTALWLLDRGLSRFTASYDLNVAQMEALLDLVPKDRVEIVIHQRMPMFHLEHCVFAAALSKGRDSTDCGRPCDLHQVSLRDRTGREHPLKADVGCRNTVYNGVPQSASPYVRGFLERGVGWFRVELMLEPPEAALRIVRAYRDLIDGRLDGGRLWRELNSSNVFGVTRGPLGMEV